MLTRAVCHAGSRRRASAALAERFVEASRAGEAPAELAECGVWLAEVLRRPDLALASFAAADRRARDDKPTVVEAFEHIRLSMNEMEEERRRRFLAVQKSGDGHVAGRFLLRPHAETIGEFLERQIRARMPWIEFAHGAADNT